MTSPDTHPGDENQAAFTSEVPTVEPLLRNIDRQIYDPRLVTVMQDFNTVLARRLPQYYGIDAFKNEDEAENEQQELEETGKKKTVKKDIRESEQIHMFRYVEMVGTNGEQKPFTRLLVVGPTPLSLNISAESITVTILNESDRAIIGQTVFVQNKQTQELDHVAARLGQPDFQEAIEDSSLAIIHFPSIEFQDTERVDLNNPSVYGFTHGPQPVADIQRLLQLNVTIKGRSGFIIADHPRDPYFNPIRHAEELVALLKQDTTEYLEDRSGPMDFEQDKEHQVKIPEENPEVVDHLIAQFKEE